MSARNVLTERDIKVVLTIHRTGPLTVDQARARFFNTPGTRAAVYRRVALLIKLGYLVPNYMPFLANTGRGKALLTLGPQGKALVAQTLGISKSEIGRTRLDSPVVLPHHLALTDVRLSFELHCERSSMFRLEEWLTERQTRQHPVQVKDPKTGQTAPLVPDGAFVLAVVNRMRQRFNLELDMGTIPVSRMKPKLRAYLLGTNEPALFVVPDKLRQAHIVSWAEEEAKALNADPTLVWVATRQDVIEHNVLETPIWQVAGGPQVAITQLVSAAPREGHHGSSAMTPVAGAIHFT